MILLKFGKREHLEMLRRGIFHFSTLDTFVADQTDFRGDSREGKLILDTRETFLIDGKNYAPYIKEAAITYVGFESILSFSASILNFDICHITEDGAYAVNFDFIEEMQQFGDSFLVLRADELIEYLEEKFQESKCYYAAHPIVYCEKTDFDGIREIFKQKKINVTSPYEFCFIKDKTPYALQNEWRCIIDDYNSEYKAQNENGANIRTSFSTSMAVFDISALETLRVSEEFLK